jgi:hypothetical protein
LNGGCWVDDDGSKHQRRYQQVSTAGCGNGPDHNGQNGEWIKTVDVVRDALGEDEKEI